MYGRSVKSDEFYPNRKPPTNTTGGSLFDMNLVEAVADFAAYRGGFEILPPSNNNSIHMIRSVGCFSNSLIRSIVYQVGPVLSGAAFDLPGGGQAEYESQNVAALSPCPGTHEQQRDTEHEHGNK